MPSLNRDAPRLARMFSKVLMEWLGKVGMRQVLDRNKDEPDEHVCHSHDFCDANEAMAEAFQRLGLEDGVTMTMQAYDDAKAAGKSEEEADRASDAMTETKEHAYAVALWNKAWATAKAERFYLTDAELKHGPTGPHWEVQ